MSRGIILFESEPFLPGKAESEQLNAEGRG